MSVSPQVPSGVVNYLAALRRALAGAPPGLIADALADCEEHLRGAMAAHPDWSEAAVLAQLVHSYGTPEEVAKEYWSAAEPPGRAASPPPARGFFGVAADPRAYGALVYLLLSLGTGVFYFTFAVTGLSMSLGFLVLIIGVPFFLLFTALLRLIALVEGRIVETLLGVRMPRRLPHDPAERGIGVRIKRVLGDMRTWSSLAYMLLMLPLGVTYFVVIVVGISLSFALAGGGLAALVDGGRHIRPAEWDNVPAWLHLLLDAPAGNLLAAAIGVLLFFVLLHLARGLGRLHGLLAESLLVRL
jgi:uncharacterized membrane protein